MWKYIVWKYIVARHSFRIVEPRSWVQALYATTLMLAISEFLKVNQTLSNWIIKISKYVKFQQDWFLRNQMENFILEIVKIRDFSMEWGMARPLLHTKVS